MILERTISDKGYTKLAEEGVDVAEDMKFSREDIDDIITNGIVVRQTSTALLKTIKKNYKDVLKIIMMKLGKSVLNNVEWIE